MKTVDNKRLFAGIVIIQTYTDKLTINNSNEHWTYWAHSKEEALGHWVIEAQKKYPQGKIIYHAIYDITEYAYQGFQFDSL